MLEGRVTTWPSWRRHSKGHEGRRARQRNLYGGRWSRVGPRPPRCWRRRQRQRRKKVGESRTSHDRSAQGPHQADGASKSSDGRPLPAAAALCARQAGPRKRTRLTCDKRPGRQGGAGSPRVPEASCMALMRGTCNASFRLSPLPRASSSRKRAPPCWGKASRGHTTTTSSVRASSSSYEHMLEESRRRGESVMH